MRKNRFITIDNPTGIMMMINEDDKEVQLCTDCIKSSETKHGYVTNTTNCKHAKEILQ